MFKTAPRARPWNAASDGSTVRVEPAKVTPAVRPVTLATDNTAPVSTSLAPMSISTVKLASSSLAAAVSAAATVGTSFVPVIVIVAVCATVPPLPSTIL